MTVAKAIVVPFDTSSRRVAIVDFQRCEVYIARVVYSEDSIRLEPSDRVIIGCPESVNLVSIPCSQVMKYNIVWNIPSQKRRLKLEGITPNEAFSYLKLNALVYNKTLAKRVINALLYVVSRMLGFPSSDSFTPTVLPYENY